MRQISDEVSKLLAVVAQVLSRSDIGSLEWEHLGCDSSLMRKVVQLA